MTNTRIRFTDGSAGKYDRAFVKANGWVTVKWTANGEERTAHHPPHRITQIEGEAKHQSPHGRV